MPSAPLEEIFETLQMYSWLRHALNLACERGQIDKPVKIQLATGEVQRDRVLTEDEQKAYLAACPQPWQDFARILVEEGFRPGEVYALRWEHILFREDGTGLIAIVDGKSKAAKRTLPMVPAVYKTLQKRFQAQGRPAEGWVFPTGSRSGHLTQDSASKLHKVALKASGVSAFVPYTLRHTALTRLGAASGGNLFALAAIAGHSTISITQRYVHPQAETIEGIFSKALQQQREQLKNPARHALPQKSRVGTELGTVVARRKARSTAA